MELTIRTNDAGLTVTCLMYDGSDGWMRIEAHLPRADMTLSELQLKLVKDGQRKLALIERALNGETITPRPEPHQPVD